MMHEVKLAVRHARGENHHLWKNNGTWWVSLTFHLPGFIKHRLRTSLGTRDITRARQLRDALLALYGFNPNAH